MGAPDPETGPVKTAFCDTVAVPVPPDATAKGVPRVSLSIDAPSETVRAYPGLDVVWIATFPYPSMTMANCVWSQNSATL